MWSIVQVTESGTLALTQQLSELRTNNTADIPMPKPTLEVWIISVDFVYISSCDDKSILIRFRTKVDLTHHIISNIDSLN